MEKIKKAVQVLSQDGVIIFPTETVYGIGCALSSKIGVQRLYQIKKRDRSKPTSIVISSTREAVKYGHFTETAKILAKKLWPGPVTFILKATKKTPSKIQGQQGTIGIRVPNNQFLLTLLQELGEPILAPSANFSGEEPTSKLNQIDKRLRNLVDYVVDEASGGEKPSTVIDLTRKKGTVLREGPISFDQIEGALANG